MILETTPCEMCGREVRRGKLYGKTWFVAKDLCGALDIQPLSKELSNKTALSCLDVDEYAMFQIKTKDKIDQQGYCISQSGALKLLMRSNVAAGREFQNWLAIEVVPTIYRDGQYAPRKTIAFHSIL